MLNDTAVEAAAIAAVAAASIFSTFTLSHGAPCVCVSHTLALAHEGIIYPLCRRLSMSGRFLFMEEPSLPDHIRGVF